MFTPLDKLKFIGRPRFLTSNVFNAMIYELFDVSDNVAYGAQFSFGIGTADSANTDSFEYTNIYISLFYINRLLSSFSPNESYFDGVNVGKSEILNNYSQYGLFSQGYLDTALSNQFDDIQNNPNSYDLYSSSQYTTYGINQFNAGVAYASNNDLSFYTFLRTLFHAPVDIFKGAINFSLPLGNGEELNLLPLMTFLLTISIVLVVVKLIKGGH